MTAALTVSLNRQLSTDSGMSLQDYAVLAVLSETPDGHCRPYELERELGIEKSRLSHHLARLSERGLVDRRRCPTDQRGWLVTLTPAGRRALRAAAPGHAAAVRAGFIDRLTPAQLRELTAMAQAVLSGMMCPEEDDVPAEGS